MPFLRFTRDSRGYESTFLVHASRRRGKSRQRILYWFRSPPNVKVGRAALDEEAIRWIEEHNPDVEFDWPKILEVGPPPPVPPVDRRRRQPDGGKGRDRSRVEGDRRREQAPPPTPQAAAESQMEEAIEQIEERIEQEIENLNPEAEPVAPPITPAAITAMTAITLIDDAREPEPEAPRPSVEPAIARVLSKEQLMSFRARFAELQARITERAGSPERMEALRARAEGLNPDTWVTEEDVRKGMADFEPQIRDMRAALGLRKRRRSRRGGRRHKRAGGEGQREVQAGEKRDGDILPGPTAQEGPSDEPNGEDDV